MSRKCVSAVVLALSLAVAAAVAPPASADSASEVPASEVNAPPRCC